MNANAIEVALTALIDSFVERIARRTAELLAAQPQQAPVPAPQGWELLTTREAAKELSCSTQKLEIARMKGGGPRFLKLGRSVRYSRADLEQWVAAAGRRNTTSLKEYK